MFLPFFCLDLVMSVEDECPLVLNGGSFDDRKDEWMIHPKIVRQW